MAKSNMKDGKPMRRNNRFPGLSGIAMVLFLFLLFPCLYAQDAIPALSRPLEPLRIPGETKITYLIYYKYIFCSIIKYWFL